MKARIFHTVVFLIGAALFAWLLADVGAATLWANIKVLGWALVPFILIEGVAEVFHVEALRRCLGADARRVPLLSLYWLRLAGSAVNYVTPTASVGGEVVTGTLLERWVGPSAAAAGVVINKLSYTVAQMWVALLGSAGVLFFVTLPLGLTVALAAGSGVIGVGLVAFLQVQRRGMVSRFLRPMARLFGGARGSAWVEKNVGALDERLKEFHAKRKGDFHASLLWHAAGFLCGFAQAYLFLAALPHDATWIHAAGVWALPTWVDMAAFFVPLGMGVQEGGRVLAFLALARPKAQGMTFGVALRIEQVFWVLLGFVAYGTLLRAVARPTAASPRTPSPDDAPPRPASASEDAS